MEPQSPGGGPKHPFDFQHAIEPIWSRLGGRSRAGPMQEYLDHKLECPNCRTIRLRIPADATESTEIKCDDCGKPLGTWASCRTILQARRPLRRFRAVERQDQTDRIKGSPTDQDVFRPGDTTRTPRAFLRRLRRPGQPYKRGSPPVAPGCFRNSPRRTGRRPRPSSVGVESRVRPTRGRAFRRVEKAISSSSRQAASRQLSAPSSRASPRSLG